jgi:hypothetical protein
MLPLQQDNDNTLSGDIEESKDELLLQPGGKISAILVVLSTQPLTIMKRIATPTRGSSGRLQ